MDNSDYRQGIFFGVNSGLITTTGLLAGIAQTTNNPIVIIISIISLAISDGVSDSYSLYISKKAEEPDDNSNGPLYSFTSLILTKIIIVLSFLLPLLFTKSLKYYKNLLWPLIWSILIISVMDYKISKIRKEKMYKYFVPHIIIILFIMFITKFFGNLLSKHE
jgi:VIT1/CCC1 family predicted Fe2+/Mn2+ transporter